MENARKISEILKVDVLFRSDFPLSDKEIQDSYEIVELLSNKNNERKFSASTNFIPNPIDDQKEIKDILTKEEYEILILQSGELNGFKLFNTDINAIKIYTKIRIFNPHFELIEKEKNKQEQIEYKYKILPKDETSYLNREVSLEPFDLGN